MSRLCKQPQGKVFGLSPGLLATLKALSAPAAPWSHRTVGVSRHRGSAAKWVGPVAESGK